MGSRGLLAVSLCAVIGCSNQDARLVELTNRVEQLEAKLAAEAKPKPDLSDEITTKKLVIVDDDGRSRGMLSAEGLALWSATADASKTLIRANNREAAIELQSRDAYLAINAWHDGTVDLARIYGKAGSLKSFEIDADAKRSRVELMNSTSNTASIAAGENVGRLYLSGTDMNADLTSYMRFTAERRPKIETSHD